LQRKTLKGPVNLAIRVPEELAFIWWELLNNEEETFAGFLSLNHSIYFSRYTGGTVWSSSPLPAEKLSILVIVAQPEDHEHVNIRREVSVIRTALAGRSRIQLRIISNPTIAKLQDCIVTLKPNIVHFVGHATFQPGGISGLVFTDGISGSEILSSSAFAEMLKHGSYQCSLVVLNACETATVGQNYDNSIAGGLVQAGIPAVIGMQCRIPSNIALAFSESFYSYLLDGFCQPVDLAVNNARLSLYSQKQSSKLLTVLWRKTAVRCR
jgi:CHAT domain-containing protein